MFTKPNPLYKERVDFLYFSGINKKGGGTVEELNIALIAGTTLFLIYRVGRFILRIFSGMNDLLRITHE